MSNFYTDVVRLDKRFNSPARCADISLLEPITRAAVINIISQAKANGTDLMVWETFRSQSRQLNLFAQGATRLSHVGVHHYGLACDLVKNVGGEPSWKGDFTFLLPLAEANGLISGINWGEPEIKHTFIDEDHVQRCSLSKQPALFAGAWYPDDVYNPFTSGP